ncbi:MAG: alpha/beta hydrolase [Acidobacteria bacterium]|nr:alpha/beta hydrolase [Acidobacteriota bacterium]
MVGKLTQRYERDGLLLDSVLYPPPGQMVDIGERKIHVQKQGTGSPTVILEAGLAASSLSWRKIDTLIAKFATVYSYDRAGFGWSPYHAGPKVARELVEEMRLAMQAVGAPIPRIVVGHSFGGMMMRMYAAMYPEEVSGVILVDALPPEEWFPLTPQRTHMLRRGVELTSRGAWLARHGIVRFALRRLEGGNMFIPRLFSALSGASGSGVASRFSEQIRKFPPETRGAIRAHWCRSSSFRAMAEYIAEVPASCAQAIICPDLGDKPLIVLSAEHGRSGHQGRQAKLAKLSTRGDFRVISGSSHWMMLEEPQVIADAVEELATNHLTIV